MCAACVAQGVTYVGGALAGLQVMAARARAKRGRSDDPIADADVLGPSDTAEAEAEGPVPARQ